MSRAQAERFERCIAVGGVVLFPSDTVYGLACDPENRVAVERLYALKGRPLEKSSAVMFFALDAALSALPEVGERTRAAMARLLPGAVTVLLPNPAGRFPLACGSDPGTLGLRVVDIAGLAGVDMPVLQSSANFAGEPEARRLSQVPERLQARVDLVIDGGELPGTASTVIDLRGYEDDGRWSVVREGAVPRAALDEPLDWQFHFDPGTYGSMIREDIPVFDRFQDEVVAASGAGAHRILELGTGTGETARRLLARHPSAELVGIDSSEQMLAAAELPPDRVALRVGRLEDELPEGPFDLVASALCVHHLNGAQKADLFRRIRLVLAPGGRFVLGDVVVPEDPAQARIELTPGYDQPSSVAEQLRWLAEAGLDPRVRWSSEDLAVVAADLPGSPAKPVVDGHRR